MRKLSSKLPVPAKENKPGLTNRRPISSSVNHLSTDDKIDLLKNHTKPAPPTGPTSSTTGAGSKTAAAIPATSSTTGARSKTAAAIPATSSTTGARSKIAAAIPATSSTTGARSKIAAAIPAAVPASSNINLKKKPLKVASSIPPYDYKARFNDLLEKHKVLRNDYNDLKYKYDQDVNEYEGFKETINSEKDTLKDELLNALKDLRDKTIELDSIKLKNDIQKFEIEELLRKTKVLAEVNSNLNEKTSQFDALQAKYNHLNKEYKVVVEVAQQNYVKLTTLSTDYDKLNDKYKKIKNKESSCETDIEKAQNVVAGMYQFLRNTCKPSQDLTGNIRVYCRIRPQLESETNKQLFDLNIMGAHKIKIEVVELNARSQSTRKDKSQHTFSFDGIFTRHSTQEEVFMEVSNMIRSALDGFNVCIFAYGQTGSGKTYTMEGGCGPDQYGIIPRAFNFIFTYIHKLKGTGFQCSIKASFLEIYNEVIYDLLCSCKDQLSYEIKMDNSKELNVSNLKEEEVKSSNDLNILLKRAQHNRQTAATVNNERSSRSHSVTQIKISAINNKSKLKYTSQLNLVDLAGSESGRTTQTMDETKHTDRSLTELSKVLLALQKNQAHISYQNSKLTHLLMPSLGGTSKTLMLVNVNQCCESFGETLSSLRFAEKVNSCCTANANKNLTLDM